MFEIDPNRYRIIDLSYEVIPPGTAERPFVVKLGLLADGAFKMDSGWARATAIEEIA